MSDIYGYKRNPRPKTVFSSEDSTLSFAGVGNPVGHLVQDWNVGYQQEIREIFEIGSSAIYWVKGRPMGQGVLGRIIGETGTSVGGALFPSEALDVCKGGASAVVSASGGVCDGKAATVKLKLDGLVVTNVAFGMNVNDLTLQENVAFRFATMSIS